MKYYQYMTAWKCNITIILIIACSACCHAQVITSWDESRLPKNGSQSVISYIEQSDMSEFQSWDNTLTAFDVIKEISNEEIKQEIANNNSVTDAIKKVFLNGQQLELPTNVNEEGIDLYMLTDEGISIYMALLAPIYYQETTQDIIKWIRYYAFNKRKYTEKLFSRYEQWQPRIAACFAANNVPTEIAELCLIESGCTYSALSSAGALGMWQIMPATGEGWGMTITSVTDDRLDPVKSTQVAAKILAKNFAYINDWTLAIASYNCGPGRVQKVQKACNTIEWLELKYRLPKETQQYIPALLAIHYVWNYRDKLGF